MIRCEMTGDWDKAVEMLKGLRNMQEKYKEIVKQISKEVAITVSDLIESQGIDMASLDAEYAKNKKERGRDGRILISSRNFVDNIEVKSITVTGSSINVKVGVLDGTTETKITNEKLAQFLEGGTSNMPKREPFKKSWEKMRTEIKEEVRKDLINAILEGLR